MRILSEVKSRPAVAVLLSLTVCAILVVLLIAGPAMSYLADRLF